MCISTSLTRDIDLFPFIGPYSAGQIISHSLNIVGIFHDLRHFQHHMRVTHSISCFDPAGGLSRQWTTRVRPNRYLGLWARHFGVRVCIMADITDDAGLKEACGVFGCVASDEWPTKVDVAHIIHLGLVGLQHRWDVPSCQFCWMHDHAWIVRNLSCLDKYTASGTSGRLELASPEGAKHGRGRAGALRCSGQPTLEGG